MGFGNFMRKILIYIFTLLGLYSVALGLIDVQLGQDAVRGYFSDIITGTDYLLPYRALFGINTTLSVSMLTGTALIFLVCIGLGQRRGRSGRPVLFQWSQVLIFLFLACDERLLIHEKVGALLHIEDALVIAGLGFVELVLLVFVGDVMQQPWKMKGWLILAAIFFALMVGVDGLLPSGMSGRLALEDLSKTWAVLFLLIYAWQYCMESASDSSGKVSDGS